MICWILVDAEGKISHLRRGQGGRLEQDLVAVSGHLRPMQPTREGQFENSVFSARAERILARKAREAALTQWEVRSFSVSVPRNYFALPDEVLQRDFDVSPGGG